MASIKRMILAGRPWTDQPAPQAESASSVTFGTGSRTWTVPIGAPFFKDQIVTAELTGSIFTMTGAVTAFDPLTGSITIDVTTSTGSGTHDEWVLTGRKYSRGSWAAELPLDNLATDALYEVARSTSADPAHTQFLVDAADFRLFDLFCLLNTNLTVNAQLRFRLLDVDATTGAFTLAYDSGLVDAFEASEPFGVLPYGLFHWDGKPEVLQGAVKGHKLPVVHFTRVMAETESQSNVEVGLGNRSFVVNDAAVVAVGQSLGITRRTDAATGACDPFTSMAGTVINKVGSTVTVDVVRKEGSGTYGDWLVRGLAIAPGTDATGQPNQPDRKDYGGRFVLVDLHDPGNPAGYLQLARLIAVKGYTPSLNFDKGFSVRVVDNSGKSRSKGGQLFSRKVPKYRVFTYTLSFLKKDEMFGQVYELDQEFGVTDPMLVILFPEDRVNRHRLTIYGPMAALGEIAHMADTADRYVRRFEQEEVI